MQAFADFVRAEQANDFWFIWIIATIAIIILILVGYRLIAKARLIQDLPTSLIRSAAQGFVELEGRADTIEGPVIISPLSKTPCCWYQYKIEKQKRTRKGSHWQTIESETSEHLFLLNDSTGHCIVDPEGADVTTAQKKTWYGSSRMPASTETNSTGFFTFGNYRYSEWYIFDNEPLYAIGHFETAGGESNDTTIKEDVVNLLRKWKQDQSKIGEFDNNNDGQIDQEEFAAMRRAAHQEVIMMRNERQNPAVNLLKDPRQRRRPFILSTIPPKKLMQQSAWQGRISLLAGTVSAVFAIYAVILRLNM